MFYGSLIGFGQHIQQLEFMSASHDGSEATDGDYKVITFTSSGTFTPTVGFNATYGAKVEHLVIAGGGGGGCGNVSGGAGAGGYLTNSAVDFSVASQSYSITVGAGGAGGVYSGAKGSDSIFSTITSTGGGQGTGGAGGAGGSGGWYYCWCW